MTRRLAAIIIALLCIPIGSTYAQPAYEVVNLVPRTTPRPWSTTPLTWESFNAVPHAPGIFYIEYGYTLGATYNRYGNLVVRDWQYSLAMFPALSWCLPDYRNEATLRLLQASFDYAEVYRRRAQQSLMNGIPLRPADMIDNVVSVSDEMALETDSGRDSVSVKKLYDVVASELAVTDVPVFSKPIIKPSGVAICGHVPGFEKGFALGRFSDYLYTSYALNVEMDVLVNRFDIMMSVKRHNGTVRTGFDNNGVSWECGEKFTGGNIDLSCGYVVLDTDWLRLTPFIGCGVAFYDYRPKSWVNAGKKADEIAGFRQIAGISADIKLFRYLMMEYPFGKAYPKYIGSLFEINLRPMVYVAHASLPNLPQLWSINCGISLDLLGRDIKRKG